MQKTARLVRIPPPITDPPHRFRMSVSNWSYSEPSARYPGLQNCGRIVVLAVLILCSPLSAWALWDSKKDNQPATVLKRMDDFSLALEARGPCAHMVWHQGNQDPPASVLDARQYLDTIRTVVRRKHKGVVPPWMQAVEAALNTTNLDACMVPLRDMREQEEKGTTGLPPTPKAKPRKTAK